MDIQFITKSIMQVGPIYSESTNGKQRSWVADIRLYAADGKQLKIESLDMELPEGVYCEYRTITGIIGMKTTTSEPTRVSTGKNLGKKNATNCLTQALADVNGKMRVKLKAGFSTIQGTTPSAAPASVVRFAFPMAVKNIADHPEKARYPCHIQSKLDGIRSVAAFVDGDVILKTRRLHDIHGFQPLRDELKKLFMSYPNRDGLFIDGELYLHGMPLQTISGIVRSETDHESRKDQLQYHVFDAFRTTGEQLPFEDRLNELKAFTKSKLERIVLVETSVVANKDEADAFYNNRIDAGFEGCIYKPFGRPYEWSFTREKRSSHYLKRKAKMDAEFEIVDFDQGQGKNLGCIVFTMTTGTHTFNVSPNGSYEYLKDLYRRAVEDFGQFRGKFATVAYEDLSDDNVPLRGRMIAFRDISFD